MGDNATRNLMLGGGSSELKVQRVISPLDGIKAKFGDNVVYAQGYTSGRPMYGRADVIPQVTVDSLRNDAVEKAMHSDLVIFVGGIRTIFKIVRVETVYRTNFLFPRMS